MTSGNHNAGTGQAGMAVGNPWEERKDLGRVSAFFASLALLATSPRRFFEGARAEAGMWGPLLFVGLVTLVGVFLNGVILTILTLTLPEPTGELLYRTEFSMDPSQLANWRDWSDLSVSPGLAAPIAIQALLFFLPVLFALTLFFMLLFGGLVHLLLVVTRTPRPQGLRGTWAVLCYANGASLLSIIPFAGDIASTVCTAVLFGFGLRAVQGVGVVRAVILSSILPLLALLSSLFGEGTDLLTLISVAVDIVSIVYAA
ncbi:MAG: YIP1 family protein [Acidobacteria bacterium]|nr:YIP1 family protein [Acidobacteriota bacterium]MCY4134731.1 YIP1 family protein [bacterium]